MSDGSKKHNGPKVSDFSKPATDRIEEVIKHPDYRGNGKEIVARKGTPKARLTGSMGREEYRWKLICYLKAVGFKNADIRRTCGASPGEISKVMRSESAKAEIERIQREIFVTEPAKMFEAILPEAVKVAVNAMMSKKINPSIRVDAAFKFMDRALGRPSQSVEVTGNLIKDLIQKMDSAPVEQPIDAEFNLVDTKTEK